MRTSRSLPATLLSAAFALTQNACSDDVDVGQHRGADPAQDQTESTPPPAVIASRLLLDDQEMVLSDIRCHRVEGVIGGIDAYFDHAGTTRQMNLQAYDGVPYGVQFFPSDQAMPGYWGMDDAVAGINLSATGASGGARLEGGANPIALSLDLTCP